MSLRSVLVPATAVLLGGCLETSGRSADDAIGAARQGLLMERPHAVRVHDFKTANHYGNSLKEFVHTEAGALFKAQIDLDGTMLWITDGTEAGTFPLTPGMVSVENRVLGALDDVTFFSSRVGSYDVLARTDGTLAGTWVLEHQGAPVRQPRTMAVGSDRAVFLSLLNGTLWIWTSDGTSAGTQPLVELTPPAGDTFAHSATMVGDRLYFFRGGALWVSDLTAVGTVAIQLVGGGYGGIGVLGGGDIVFAGSDAATGTELWISDGTTAGTKLLRDLRPGTAASSPGRFTRLGSQIVFVADDAPGAPAVWVTDGTPSGTTRLSPCPWPGCELAVLGQVAYFLRRTPPNLESLWRTDGTLAGTWPVYAPTTAPFDIEWLSACGGALYFTAYEPSAGAEPWTSDGTAAGTRLISDTLPGSASVNVTGAGCLGDGWVFYDQQGDALWTTDGTPQGTRRIRGFFRSIGGNPQNGVAHADRLYLHAEGPSGWGVWMTEQLDAGATQLGPPTYQFLNASWRFARVPAGVVFPWFLPGAGREYWITDGTQAGTQMLADLAPGAANGGPSNLLELDGGIAVGLVEASPTGMALWRTDGTAAGTFPIAPGVQVFSHADALRPEARMAEGFVFTGNTPDAGVELWYSDGTTQGTRLLVDVAPGPASGVLSHPFSDGANAYFIAKNGSQTWLWRKEGLDGGVAAVARAEPIINGESYYLTHSGGGVWFRTATFNFSTAREMWRVDQAGSATRVIANPTGEVGRIFALPPGVVVEVWGGPQPGLWFTDGTDGGMHRLPDLAISGDPGAVLLLEPENRLLFAASDSKWGTELWVTDGTVANTRRITDISRAASSSGPRHLVRQGAHVYFAATEGFSGHELWAVSMDLVLDDTPPVVGCPAPMSLELTGPRGARATFLATATDDLTPFPELEYAPKPGSWFALGDSIVGVTARDEAGNQSACTFEVAVLDTVAPELACGPSVELRLAPGEEDVLVDLPPSVALDLSGKVTVRTSHPSPARLGLGVTTIAVHAADVSGNVSACEYEVTVLPPPDADAGQALEPDAGEPADAGEAADPGGDADAGFEVVVPGRGGELSCGCTAAPPSCGALWFLLGLLACIARKKQGRAGLPLREVGRFWRAAPGRFRRASKRVPGCSGASGRRWSGTSGAGTWRR